MTPPVQRSTVVLVRARIAQIWSRRDPVKVDIALAIVLTVSALLAIWFGGDAPHHKLPASLLAPAGPVPIAAIIAPISIESPAPVVDRSADGLRPVPPDPPPPRA